ncbi:hypothetical protein C5S29_12195 [ANME-1 cluster archaeon GoMg3.2]|nr:hypothetical protein [ANME-1 cluster archaeon GoMg3.2]
MYPKEELRGITGEAKSAWVKKGLLLVISLLEKNLDLHKRKFLRPLTMASYSTALMLYSEIHISSWFEVK